MNIALLATVFVVLLGIFSVDAQKFPDRYGLSFSPNYGQQFIKFPTTTTHPLAQANFTFGMAALHVFEYDDAAQAFQNAYAVDPCFVMAYWGAALTFYHPVWQRVYVGPAKEELAKYPADKCTIKSTKEQLYWKAVNDLYSKSTNTTNFYVMDVDYDKYHEDMLQIVNMFPDDIEPKLLSAVSMFAITIPERRGFMERNATVYNKIHELINTALSVSPNHPGAIHYLIHASDDPIHAPIVLPTASRFPKVAPAAAHAIHMPSHLYLRVGDFQRAVWGNSMWCDGLELSQHNLEFAHYVHLQQGLWSRATLEMLFVMQKDDDNSRAQSTLFYARQLIDTFSVDKCDPSIIFTCTSDECKTPGLQLMWLQGKSGVLLVCGFRQAQENNEAAVLATISQLKDIAVHVQADVPFLADSISAMVNQLMAVLSFRQGNFIAANSYAQRAVSIEESVNPPAYGPPIDPIKCSNELYGELLLQMGNYSAAIEQFKRSFAIFPNRTLTLLGFARAYKGLNDKQNAQDYYSRIFTQLELADVGNPIFNEAALYLQQKQDM